MSPPSLVAQTISHFTFHGFRSTDKPFARLIIGAGGKWHVKRFITLEKKSI